MLSRTARREAQMLTRSGPRLVGGHYMGPKIPGHFQFLSPLPKPPKSFGEYEITNACPETKEIVFPFRMAYHEAYLLPFWTEVGNWAMTMVCLWGSLYYYNYKFLGKNPPNPPRSKADDYKMRPVIHPHTSEEDDD